MGSAARNILAGSLVTWTFVGAIVRAHSAGRTSNMAHRFKLGDEVVVSSGSHRMFRQKGRVAKTNFAGGYIEVDFLTGRRTIWHESLALADAITRLSLLSDPE